jgi:hypothetical protein
MESYSVSATVQRFPGPTGWYYVELPTALDGVFRPLVRQRWPALVGLRCTVGATTWDGSMMPIKDGPLFIALPAKIRKREQLDVGSAVTVGFTLREPA